MIVSDVGRTTSGSSSSLPPARVTTARFGREALDVLRLLRQEALGNEQREIGVEMTRRLEHLVQGRLHVLPDGVTGRADDHASADGAVVRQLGAA